MDRIAAFIKLPDVCDNVAVCRQGRSHRRIIRLASETIWAI